MVKCKQCGNDFDELYGVCPKCGWVYEEEEKLPEIKLPENTLPEIKGYTKEKPASKKKSKAKLFVIIGIIAAVVIAGIIVGIILANSNKGGTSEFDEQISLGEKYLSEENYDDAIIAFQKAIEIDPNNPESYIKLADAYLGKGDAESAKAALEKGYSMTKSEEIKKKLYEVEQLIDRQSGSSTILAAGDNHSVGLKKDGTVVAAGDNSYGQCDVGDWTKISEVYAGCYNTFGLKKDGTVVAAGINTDGQCEVGEWTDIVSISVSSYHTVGLKKDGTVVAAGSNKYGRCNVSDWTDIKAVAAGGEHTVGLKEDGTVVAVGSNSSGQCEVSEWSDIVAISAGGNHTVGLKKDGTVVATKVRGLGYMRGQSYVEDWTDIVAISAGWYHTVGLKKDGTVVAAGDNRYSQCNIKNWTDIVTLYAGCYHTIGQKTDGTIVAIGQNEYNQCDLSDWTLKMPYKILIQQPGTETEESSIEESSIEESSEEESSIEESSKEESSKEESSKEESSKEESSKEESSKEESSKEESSKEESSIEESSIEESSDSEISDPSNTTTDSDGSVYHLDFSQNSYKDSTEVIGNTHIVNTTKIKQKKAMSFDGDGDYIKCGNGLNLTEQYSFSTYLCCDDVDKTYSAFFAKYEQNQHGSYAYSIKNGRVNIWITTDNNQNHIELESNTKLNNGQWYYITIVKDKLNLKLYINGVKENECEIPGYIKNNDLVTVGRQAFLFSPEDQLQFTGSIAFLSVFDTSLSDSEIKARYNKIK